MQLLYKQLLGREGHRAKGVGQHNERRIRKHQYFLHRVIGASLRVLKDFREVFFPNEDSELHHPHRALGRGLIYRVVIHLPIIV
jgi:hypothetical protein